MNRARWNYIKSLPANTARYFHVSAPIAWITNPITNVQQPMVRKRDRRFPAAPGMIGDTYNVGRNAEKRARRGVA